MSFGTKAGYRAPLAALPQQGLFSSSAMNQGGCTTNYQYWAASKHRLMGSGSPARTTPSAPRSLPDLYVQWGGGGGQHWAQQTPVSALQCPAPWSLGEVQARDEGLPRFQVGELSPAPPGAQEGPGAHPTFVRPVWAPGTHWLT